MKGCFPPIYKPTNMKLFGKKNYAAKVATVLWAAFFLYGCASAPAQKALPALRESRPRSILVMPPVNLSLDIDAPDVFLATSTVPLAESGYYVIPAALSQEMFRQNGIHSASDAHAIDYRRLREVFGADAALYITVTRFGVSYQVLRSVVQAYANAALVDLRTGLEIWAGRVAYEDEVGNQLYLSGANLAEQLLAMIIGAAIEQVANVIFNQSYEAGRRANSMLLSAENSRGLLYGPYHPKFGTD